MCQHDLDQDLCISMGAENKAKASKIVDDSFWENVPNSYRDVFHRVLPPNPLKNNVLYDLKAYPSRCLGPTLSLCRELGQEVSLFVLQEKHVFRAMLKWTPKSLRSCLLNTRSAWSKENYVVLMEENIITIGFGIR